MINKLLKQQLIILLAFGVLYGIFALGNKSFNMYEWNQGIMFLFWMPISLGLSTAQIALMYKTIYK